MTAPSSAGRDETIADAAPPPGGLRDASVAMRFRVRISPTPNVIDEVGDSVPKSRVLEISFQSDRIETPGDPRNVVAGPGVAKILVGDITIRGVPLC